MDDNQSEGPLPLAVRPWVRLRGGYSKGMSNIRVYLVDDQTMIRAAMRSLLDRQEGFEVVGDHSDPREAVEEIASLRPDIALLDISMPGLSGLDAIGRIPARAPKTRVVMLTNHEGQTFVEQALKAGAQGYLSKDSEESELVLALRSAHRGEAYVSPKVTSGIVSQVRGSSAGEPAPASKLASLTPREREVFQLLAIGHSNKEVARDLGLSLGTAKKHRENLQRKLDCHSAAELARLAIREGLVST